MLKALPSRRIVNLAGFAACAAMMGFALYAQYGLLLDPCPLCIFQRIAVIALGFVFLVAAIHDPAGAGRKAYAVLLAIVAASGVAVAGWHVRMQNLPPDELPSCGPGLDYMLESFPLGEALRMVFTGSGECGEVLWRFLGLSMPAWVLIGVGTLGIVGAWNGFRRQAEASL